MKGNNNLLFICGGGGGEGRGGNKTFFKGGKCTYVGILMLDIFSPSKQQYPVIILVFLKVRNGNYS